MVIPMSTRYHGEPAVDAHIGRLMSAYEAQLIGI